MPVTITSDVDHAALRRLLSSPTGPVGRKVHEVTERVAAACRAHAPIQDGTLKSSIKTAYRASAHEYTGIVYSDLEYSQYVQRGTGIYGPRHAPIRPRRASVLVFEAGGATVFARQVRGQRPNPFMLEGLRAGSPWGVREERL